MTLADFLLARIAEDETVARTAYSEGSWRSGTTYSAFVSVEAFSWTVASDLERSDADHIARHDPARVLAECAAKRRIVKRIERAADAGDVDDSPFDLWLADDILAALALPYADHPDYREEWRP